MTKEPMLKAKDVAEWLGIHVNTVKRLGDRGELPFFRIGTRGDRRYRPSDVETYLSGRGVRGNRKSDTSRNLREGDGLVNGKGR
jgi:excisionase family DNA binding protein